MHPGQLKLPMHPGRKFAESIISKIVQDIGINNPASRIMVIGPTHRLKLFLHSRLQQSCRPPHIAGMVHVFTIEDLIIRYHGYVKIVRDPVDFIPFMVSFLKSRYGELWQNFKSAYPLVSEQVQILEIVLRDIDRIFYSTDLRSEDYSRFPGKVMKLIGTYYKAGSIFELQKEFTPEKWNELVKSIPYIEDFQGKVSTNGNVQVRSQTELVGELWEYLSSYIDDFFCYVRDKTGVPCVLPGYALFRACKDMEENDWISAIIGDGYTELHVVFSGFFKNLEISFIEKLARKLADEPSFKVRLYRETSKFLDAVDKSFNLLGEENTVSRQWKTLRDRLEQGGVQFEEIDIGEPGTIIKHHVDNDTAQFFLIRKNVNEQKRFKSKLIVVSRMVSVPLMVDLFPDANLAMGIPVAYTSYGALVRIVERLMHFSEKYMVPEDWYSAIVNITRVIGKVNRTTDLLEILRQSSNKSLLERMSVVLKKLSKNDVLLKELSSIFDMYIKEGVDIESSIYDLRHFLRWLLERKKVILSSEPLQELQALGLKETAALAFDVVYFTDCFRDALVKVGRPKTLIPFTIWKGMLGISEVHDYYVQVFLIARLVNLAREAHFFIPAKVGDRTQQPLLFVDVIAGLAGKESAEKRVYTVDTTLKKTSDNGGVYASCILNSEDESGKHSSSDNGLVLNVDDVYKLLVCPRKFLLSRFLRFKDTEIKLVYKHNPLILGNVVHKVLRRLYVEYSDESYVAGEQLVNSVLSKSNEDLRDKVESLVLEYMEEEVSRYRELITVKGYDVLTPEFIKRLPIYKVANSYVFKILDIDRTRKDELEKSEVYLEEKEIYQVDDNIRLTFKPDRKEVVIDGDARIVVVDYKTGSGGEKKAIKQIGGGHEETILNRIKYIYSIIRGIVNGHIDGEQPIMVEKIAKHFLQLLIYMFALAENSSRSAPGISDNLCFRGLIYFTKYSTLGIEEEEGKQNGNKKKEFESGEIRERWKVLRDLLRLVGSAIDKYKDDAELLGRLFPPIKYSADICGRCEFAEICGYPRSDDTWQD